MDNLNKYLPVGQDNAVEATIVTASGNTMMGTAWIESNTATEVSVQAHTEIDNQLWIVAGSLIAAIGMEIPPASRSTG
jgi:hypothetical protein